MRAFANGGGGHMTGSAGLMGEWEDGIWLRIERVASLDPTSISTHAPPPPNNTPRTLFPRVATDRATWIHSHC